VKSLPTSNLLNLHQVVAVLTGNYADAVMGHVTPLVPRCRHGGLHSDLVADFQRARTGHGRREAQQLHVDESDPVGADAVLPVHLQHHFSLVSSDISPRDL
jgi:hypothetical protein